MIGKETLLEYKQWFKQYASTFYSESIDYQKNNDLKIFHTSRVCERIIEIGESLNFSDEQLILAETMALFHDIGRFEQYKRYQTFSDRLSEDHALLGVKVLKENDVFKNLDEYIKELLYKTISFHNRFRIPQEETDEVIFYSELLRDADKLDIFRIVCDYYPKKDKNEYSSIQLDLPDHSEISDEVVSSILDEKMVKTAHLKTLNDFKLLQVSWVYDLNFQRSYQILKERKYIEVILGTIIDDGRLKDINTKVAMVINEKCLKKVN